MQQVFFMNGRSLMPCHFFFLFGDPIYCVGRFHPLAFLFCYDSKDSESRKTFKLAFEMLNEIRWNSPRLRGTYPQAPPPVLKSTQKTPIAHLCKTVQSKPPLRGFLICAIIKMCNKLHIYSLAGIKNPRKGAGNCTVLHKCAMGVFWVNLRTGGGA